MKKIEFTKIPILDEILESVKETIPKELAYIKILQTSCGWEQYNLDVYFYDADWKQIDLPIDDFSEHQQEKFDEVCLCEYIHNSLIGMSKNDFVNDYFEFITNKDYYYKYDNNKL